MPRAEPKRTSKGWCRASMIRDIAIHAAANVGIRTMTVRQTSPFWSRTWSLAARYKDRKKSPANDDEEWPEGNDRKPGKLKSGLCVKRHEGSNRHTVLHDGRIRLSANRLGDKAIRHPICRACSRLTTINQVWTRLPTEVLQTPSNDECCALA